VARLVSALGPRCGAIALGLLADRALGEVPTEVHPVAAFGTVMGRVERKLWSDRRAPGLAYTTVGVLIGAVAGALTRSTAGTLAVCVAGRELRQAAKRINDHLDEDDLGGARRELPWLVGRDPSQLDASGVAAAVIESVAENSVDAVVAPVWWALVAGAPGAAIYRAINTMDAMVGHRSDRYRHFGWAAARLDDVANWLPARLFAGLVILVEPGRARRIVTLVGRDAAAHPSPNAGVAETAVAAALGVRLGGPLWYGNRAERRPYLGDGARPRPDDIVHAISLASRSEILLIGTLAAVWLVDRLGWGHSSCGLARRWCLRGWPQRR
jgi:adenosylcobinamide-phosphate synthase